MPSGPVSGSSCASSRPSGGSVFLLEDEPHIRHLVSHTLSEAYALTLATTYGDAIDWIERKPFDVLLLDIRIPGSASGIDVLHHARTAASSQNLETPAVAFTACVMPGDQERLLAEGFDDYLPKPFSKNDLFGVLSHLQAH